jgi:phosphate/sulfate permease
LAITVAGLLVGYFLEGSKMSNSILGKLVPSSISLNDILAGLAVAFALFTVLTIIKIPVSLSNCVVGAFLGVGLASGAGFNEFFLIEILSSWIAAPFLCAILTVLIYELAVGQESRFSLVTISWVNRILLIVIVFYVAYALGANSLGLIFSFLRTLVTSNGVPIVTEIGIYLAMIAGTLLFGKTLAKIVGEKIVGLSQVKTLAGFLGTAIVTWSFTQLAIPVSLTQVLIGGMLGAGAARGPTVVNKREIVVMVRDWAVVTILCAAFGFGLDHIIGL